MKFEVARAREWFHLGLPLANMVDKQLALDIELFTRGGLEILNAIERQGYDVLTRRPAISKSRKLWLVARAAVGGCCERAPLQLRAAYAVCRHIARSAARNFYYGFLVLPSRSAMRFAPCTPSCVTPTTSPTIPTLPPEQRREKLGEWMSALRRVDAGERTDDPVLLALADAEAL